MTNKGSLVETTWQAILEPARRGVELRPGCSLDELGEAEKAIGVVLPPALVDLLEYSDGLFDTAAEYSIVWTLSAIVERNLQAWRRHELQLPASLLGFGDDGAGDWFCLSIDAGDDRVHYLYWIDGTPRPVATGLAAFLPQWLDGDLKV